MSHFCVYVFTKDRPDEDTLSTIMAPWYEREDGSNPNAKWDWYSVGGRWTGCLVPNYEPSEDPDNQEICIPCQGTGQRDDQYVQGKCNDCNGTGTRAKWPTQWKQIGNQAQLQDVPIIALRDAAEKRALAEYDTAMKIISGVAGVSESTAWEQIPNWNVIKDDPQYPDILAKRDAYCNHPIIKALQAARDEKGRPIMDLFDGPNYLRCARRQRARTVRNGAFSAFAIVDAREEKPMWYERGEMGWWAIVTDEKDKDQWAEEFSKLVDAMNPLTWITVVDCHI